MFKEGDWVKLAADDSSLDLKMGMLGQVTLVLNDPSTKSRTIYLVQLLSDGMGLLTPAAAGLPVVGEATDFLLASPGEIIFAIGAQSLKEKFLPPDEPATFSSSSEPVSPQPAVPLPAQPEKPADNNAALLLLLLPLLFSKDVAGMFKALLIFSIVAAVVIALLIAFVPPSP